MYLESLLAKYGEAIFLVLFMANLPLYFWVLGTLKHLVLEKQDNRIPKLLWMMMPNKNEYMDLASLPAPETTLNWKYKNWKYFVLIIGLILPIIVLASPEMMLGKRLAIVSAGGVLFILEMAIFKWFIRPRSE